MLSTITLKKSKIGRKCSQEKREKKGALRNSLQPEIGKRRREKVSTSSYGGKAPAK